MNWKARIKNYSKITKFPKSLFIADDGRVVGIWIMGNNYQVKSTYYGGYPPTYLRRVAALFPDKKRVLHLFSGQVDLVTMPGDTVDINKELKPTYVDDAQTLLKVPVHKYNLILADIPYSVEDCNHYQCAMVKRNLVFRALSKTAKPGTFVVWMDQVLPMWRKDYFHLEGVIGLVKSSNHRFRVVSIFRRTENAYQGEYEKKAKK